MHRALVIEDQNLMRLALMTEIRAGLPDCYVAVPRRCNWPSDLDDRSDL
ncbi:MAG: hypothetical protein R3D70_24230 [Rhizobiaceae bacterium]